MSESNKAVNLQPEPSTKYQVPTDRTRQTNAHASCLTPTAAAPAPPGSAHPPHAASSLTLLYFIACLTPTPHRHVRLLCLAHLHETGAVPTITTTRHDTTRRQNQVDWKRKRPEPARPLARSFAIFRFRGRRGLVCDWCDWRAQLQLPYEFSYSNTALSALCSPHSPHSSPPPWGPLDSTKPIATIASRRPDATTYDETGRDVDVYDWTSRRFRFDSFVSPASLWNPVCVASSIGASANSQQTTDSQTRPYPPSNVET